MSQKRIEGNGKQYTAMSSEKPDKAAGDGLAASTGEPEQSEGKLQERFGYSREVTRKELDTFAKGLKSSLLLPGAPIQPDGASPLTLSAAALLLTEPGQTPDR